MNSKGILINPKGSQPLSASFWISKNPWSSPRWPPQLRCPCVQGRKMCQQYTAQHPQDSWIPQYVLSREAHSFTGHQQAGSIQLLATGYICRKLEKTPRAPEQGHADLTAPSLPKSSLYPLPVSSLAQYWAENAPQVTHNQSVTKWHAWHACMWFIREENLVHSWRNSIIRDETRSFIMANWKRSQLCGREERELFSLV